MGLVCFVVFWWIACLVNRRLIASEHYSRSYNLPLVYLTFTYAFLCYFTSGLEAPLVNLIAVVYAAAILWPENKLLQALIGFSPLVRQELLLPCFIFLAYQAFAKRIIGWTVLLTFGIFVGGYGLFRIWYYAELPNTFYLKDLTWIPQGLDYLSDTALPYHTLPYLLAAALSFKALSNRSNHSQLLTVERLAMVLISLPTIAYVIKIGGDPRHFRYLAFPYVLLVLATGGIAERICEIYAQCAPRFMNSLLVLFSLLMFSSFPRQLEKHPILRVPMKDINRQVNLIGDAAAHRLRKNQLTPPWGTHPDSLSYHSAKLRYQTELEQKTILNTLPVGDVIPQNSKLPGKTSE